MWGLGNTLRLITTITHDKCFTVKCQMLRVKENKYNGVGHRDVILTLKQSLMNQDSKLGTWAPSLSTDKSRGLILSKHLESNNK